MAIIDKNTVKNVWGSHDSNWFYLPADNTADDIFICWRLELMEFIDYIKGETFISCLFVNKKNEEK